MVASPDGVPAQDVVRSKRKEHMERVKAPPRMKWLEQSWGSETEVEA